MKIRNKIPQIIRFILGIILPVPLGILLTTLNIKDLPELLIFGYFVMGVPSLLFTAVIEFALSKCDKTSHFIGVVLWGSLIGFLSGLLLAAIILHILFVGLIVGAIVSSLLAVIYIKTDYSKKEPLNES